MKYDIQAKNRETGKFESIGESDDSYVDKFWLAGRINYLNMFEKKNYSHDETRIVLK